MLSRYYPSCIQKGLFIWRVEAEVNVNNSREWRVSDNIRSQEVENKEWGELGSDDNHFLSPHLDLLGHKVWRT